MLVALEVESITVTYILVKSLSAPWSCCCTSYLAAKQVAEIWAGSVEMLKKKNKLEPKSSRENCGYSSVSMT